MRTPAPLQLVLQFPQTKAGQQALRRSVSEIHADFVVSTINKLNCPAAQKRELLLAVINTVRGSSPSYGLSKENLPQSGQNARIRTKNGSPKK